MKGPTKAEKLAEYDSLKSELSNYRLALYDLVNKRFAYTRVFSAKEIKETYDRHWRDGSVTVRMSFRAMPLFVVETRLKDRIDVQVFAETEIQDQYWQSSSYSYSQMLMVARNSLMHEAIEATKKTEVSQ